MGKVLVVNGLLPLFFKFRAVNVEFVNDTLDDGAGDGQEAGGKALGGKEGVLSEKNLTLGGVNPTGPAFVKGSFAVKAANQGVFLFSFLSNVYKVAGPPMDVMVNHNHYRAFFVGIEVAEGSAAGAVY